MIQWRFTYLVHDAGCPEPAQSPQPSVICSGSVGHVLDNLSYCEFEQTCSLVTSFLLTSDQNIPSHAPAAHKLQCGMLTQCPSRNEESTCVCRSFMHSDRFCTCYSALPFELGTFSNCGPAAPFDIRWPPGTRFNNLSSISALRELVSYPFMLARHLRPACRDMSISHLVDAQHHCAQTRSIQQSNASAPWPLQSQPYAQKWGKLVAILVACGLPQSAIHIALVSLTAHDWCSCELQRIMLGLYLVCELHLRHGD